MKLLLLLLMKQSCIKSEEILKFGIKGFNKKIK